MQRVLDMTRRLDGKEIPVCAIIVKNGEIIASASNTKESENDVTAHAEILAIRKAEKALGSWRLDGCELYVNLEPCPMCAWAIIQSRLSTVYFGSFDKNYGALGSVIDLRSLLNSNLKVYGGIMEEECNKILEDYFAGLRCCEKIRGENA